MAACPLRSAPHDGLEDGLNAAELLLAAHGIRSGCEKRTVPVGPGRYAGDARSAVDGAQFGYELIALAILEVVVDEPQLGPTREHSLPTPGTDCRRVRVARAMAGSGVLKRHTPMRCSPTVSRGAGKARGTPDVAPSLSIGAAWPMSSDGDGGLDAEEIGR